MPDKYRQKRWPDRPQNNLIIGVTKGYKYK